MNKEIKIGYGVLLPSIGEQLEAQGLKLKNPEKYEKYRHSINVLYFADLLNATQQRSILQKLHNQITKDVEEI